MVIMYLALACGVGALVRYFLSTLNQERVLPLGTLLANLLGCFLIGLFYNYVEDKELNALYLLHNCKINQLKNNPK
ncbi:CrcB family protein, partial [Streptococcus pneumoniae]|nr:CrcB family protein [Streptococcus pneumoniae]